MAGIQRLRKEIDSWESRGLIDAATAAALRQDVAGRTGGFSFANALGMLAALLVAASVITFVAANWDGVPRLGRVGLIFAVISGGYIGGALLQARGHDRFGQLAYLVAAAAFGGGIALIAQMYNMSGDETAAILTWCLGTLGAAALLRSSILTIAAVALAALYLVMASDWFSTRQDFALWFPLLAAFIWAVSLWTSSVASRQLLVVVLWLWGVLAWINLDNVFALYLLIAVFAALFAFAAANGKLAENLLRLNGRTAALAFAGFSGAYALVQVLHEDDTGLFTGLAVLAILASVGAVYFAGDRDRPLRFFAYAMFAVEIMLVYFLTIGSLIGTSGFFLTAGLMLALVAWLILRLERRMAAKTSGEAA